MTPMQDGMNCVADMTGVQEQMGSRTSAKIDASEFLARLGMEHPKVVCWRFVYGMVNEFYELELQLTVHQVGDHFQSSRLAAIGGR